MYMSGKLTGIYTGFNGYGTTKKDFFKQVHIVNKHYYLIVTINCGYLI